MPDVFISHASTDQWRADRVCEALEAGGIICWIAPRDVPRKYPNAWGEGTLQTRVLQDTRLFLLLLSRDSATSPRIAREIKAAMRQRRAWLSIPLDPSTPEPMVRLPSELGGMQNVDLSSLEPGGENEALTAVVRAALEGAERPIKGHEDESPFAFVSYKREDLARIKPHLRTLARIGCPLWHDSGIPGGAEWDAMIEARVRQCRLMLVFLSAPAIASKQVRREVKFADKLDKPIIPILLEPVELDGGLDMLLSPYQIIDSRHRDFEAQLETAVRRALPRLEGDDRRAGREGSSMHSEGSELDESETTLLNYMRGKPDVEWSLDVLANLLHDRPEVAITVRALERSVRALTDKGYLRADGENRLIVTPKAVTLFRRGADGDPDTPG